jgi:hypothetical protein
MDVAADMWAGNRKYFEQFLKAFPCASVLFASPAKPFA